MGIYVVVKRPVGRYLSVLLRVLFGALRPPIQESSCYGMTEESREMSPLCCLVYMLYWVRSKEVFFV
jgi:hypothetical protein